MEISNRQKKRAKIGGAILAALIPLVLFFGKKAISSMFSDKNPNTPSLEGYVTAQNKIEFNLKPKKDISKKTTISDSIKNNHINRQPQSLAVNDKAKTDAKNKSGTLIRGGVKYNKKTIKDSLQQFPNQQSKSAIKEDTNNPRELRYNAKAKNNATLPLVSYKDECQIIAIPSYQYLDEIDDPSSGFFRFYTYCKSCHFRVFLENGTLGYDVVHMEKKQPYPEYGVIPVPTKPGLYSFEIFDKKNKCSRKFPPFEIKAHHSLNIEIIPDTL